MFYTLELVLAKPVSISWQLERLALLCKCWSYAAPLAQHCIWMAHIYVGCMCTVCIAEHTNKTKHKAGGNGMLRWPARDACKHETDTI